MDFSLDNLKRLLDNLKNIGFFDRIFNWKKITRQLVDASADLYKLIANSDSLRENIARLELRNNGLDKDIRLANDALIKKDAEIARLSSIEQSSSSKIKDLTADLSSARAFSEKHESRKNELEIELAELKRDLVNVQEELAKVRTENTSLKKDEEFRKKEHSNALASLENIRHSIQSDRAREIEDRSLSEIERIRKLKETWSDHEQNVAAVIKSICQKHTIEYIAKVPFKGDPDNALLICDEYVVFDAKSPGGDDLDHFPVYLRSQAEKAKKYASQENVKSDIFFVVPANTLECLNTYVHRHGDYNVYVVSVDALEPVILSLRKIEEYEFADQLDPQDRENICRILGRFAHLSKRRVQVDNFFAKQFIELVYKCETDLPNDILDSVSEFEKSERLNPPQEKKAKTISVIELEKDSKKIRHEADGKDIVIEDETISNSINDIPLYKKVAE